MRVARPLAGCLLLLPLVVAPPLAAQLDRSSAEAAGLEPATAPPPSPAGAKRLRGVGTSLLLIPDSTADRIMAFDPTTGNLVDADFIPADVANLSTPKAAILHTDAASVLVSDQIDDVVQRYSAVTGAYLGVFAPAGGANTAILDNILGIAYRPNGNLLVTVDAGANQDTVAEFNAAGTHVGNFITAGLGGLDAPFDVYFRAADVLVTSINSDNVLRYDLNGAFLNIFAATNNFPQQIAEASNGNVLIANFGGTLEGILEYTAAGVFVGQYNPATVGGNRGVYELPNGNILTTNGSGVFEVSRAGVLVDTKITGVSAQYIELATGIVPVELLSIDVE
jgi:hypothetical protein